MVDLMRGRSPSSRRIPPQVMEFFMAKEFGWSYEQIMNTPIPFIMGILGELRDFNKAQEASMKKGRRK